MLSGLRSSFLAEKWHLEWNLASVSGNPKVDRNLTFFDRCRNLDGSRGWLLDVVKRRGAWFGDQVRGAEPQARKQGWIKETGHYVAKVLSDYNTEVNEVDMKNKAKNEKKHCSYKAVGHSWGWSLNCLDLLHHSLVFRLSSEPVNG